MEEEQRRALVAAAVGAKERAYSKYSNFPVGAALLCRDGTVVTGKIRNCINYTRAGPTPEFFAGCSVDNAAHNLGLCAERTAVVKAVSEGRTEFAAVAVVS